MKTGGRRPLSGGGGGARSPSTFDRHLIQVIESIGTHKFATTEQLADHIRSVYPQYARNKLQPFTKRVEQIVSSINTKFAFDDDEDEDDRVETPSRKKRKGIDKREEKLQLIEAQHINKLSGKDVINGVGPSSASTVSTSTSDSGSGSDSSEGISESEDAVYGEKVELEFDLMRSMLRDSYSQKSKKTGKDKDRQVDVELDIVNSKYDKELNLMTTTRAQGIGSSPAKRSNGDGNTKNGPMFKDLGGMSKVIEDLMMEVVVPLCHPQLPVHLGVRPMAGILLHGPPGCGKTKLAHAIANETGVPFYRISATELVSGVSGASEENIRDLFSKAYRTAPSIVFIDEIDAIASKRENLQREMERRIVTQLMTCMDESHRSIKGIDGNANSESSDHRPGYILVIGATNRPDAIDPALRRPGRFDREIALGVPSESERLEILTVLTQNLKVEGSFDLLKIARLTPGFVGADLEALANKAGNLAIKRIVDQRKAELSREQEEDEDSEQWWRQTWSPEEMENLSIAMSDFEEAAKIVQPSSRREGFSSIPNVKWEDVGGLNLLRQEFDRYIVRRIKYPEDYEDFGVDLETGFLLYGPPGCGKTLIAKAVANEAGANFIHIKGPELLNKYVGESELAVRTIFRRARTCSPCILFFDEVDALTTKRGKEGGWVVERLLNQLLIELDGADQRRGVYVIGATNRPEVMDPAALRPGRFGKLLYVPLPTPDERGLILKALARKKPIDASVDLMAIANDGACANLSGADLSALITEAAMAALEDKPASECRHADRTPRTIKDVHFKQALEKIFPSVSDKQKEYYERLSKNFKAA